jgi:hypothetical protein
MKGRRDSRCPSGRGAASQAPYAEARRTMLKQGEGNRCGAFTSFSSHFIPFDSAITYISFIVVQESPGGAPDNNLARVYNTAVHCALRIHPFVLETPLHVPPWALLSSSLSLPLTRRLASHSRSSLLPSVPLRTTLTSPIDCSGMG